MRIFFEDYYGNDLCNFNINELINISQIKNLTECSIADVENDILIIIIQSWFKRNVMY